MSFSPLYTTVDSVKVRLANKVQFQKDPNTIGNGEMPNLLLAQQISDAEAAIELALRSRYMVPFQSKRTGAFADLPDHTKRQLRRLVDMKAVMLILGTEFGTGTHVSADPYYKNLLDEYKDQLADVLGRGSDISGESDKIERYRYAPPLEDLRLAATNLESSDNGYRGKIINTDASRDGVVDYAKDHINDPSQSYIRKPRIGGF